jgi:hypothetical protein
MKARYIIMTIVIIYLAITLVAAIFVIKEEPEAESTHTLTPTPTVQKTQCEIDTENTQVALDDYFDAHGSWPTSNGSLGKIEWDKLVPEFLSATPSTANSCKWQVNSNPEGQVCKPSGC